MTQIHSLIDADTALRMYQAEEEGYRTPAQRLRDRRNTPEYGDMAYEEMRERRHEQDGL